jgi:enoyl-CoA hydratase/carnithine racemase
MSEVKLGFDVRGIASITVNRLDAGNSLSFRSQQAFAEAVNSMAAMPFLRTVMITGSGNLFISGADILELRQYPTREDGARLATVMGDALNKLEDLPLISIAVINGPAHGGGAEIALACDIRLMAAEADIAFVHAGLGLLPGWGGGERLARVVGHAHAMELMASGRVLGASEAWSIGLVNAVHPRSELMNAAETLAEQIAEKPQAATSTIKRMFRAYRALSPAKARQKEREAFVELWDRDERRELFKKWGKEKSKPRARKKVITEPINENEKE